jgi:hypothetical protein
LNLYEAFSFVRSDESAMEKKMRNSKRHVRDSKQINDWARIMFNACHRQKLIVREEIFLDQVLKDAFLLTIPDIILSARNEKERQMFVKTIVGILNFAQVLYSRII